MQLVSFDVETSGTQREYALQPARLLTQDAWITSYATAQRGTSGYETQGFLKPDRARLQAFLIAQAQARTTIVCWNAAFDIAWLIGLGLTEEVMACQWLDAMLLWRHLTLSPQSVATHPKSYGLKACVAANYPTQADYGSQIDFSDASPQAQRQLLKYNRKDALFTVRLAERFWEKLTPLQQTCALIEARCLPLVAAAWVAGLHIDLGAAHQLDAKLDADIKIAYVTLKLQNGEVTPEILASPKQLGELLYTTWGLPLTHFTATGRESTDKDALHTLALMDPRAQRVRDYREAFTNRTKFVASTLESVSYNGDGCTRPQARVYGTYTGRMTYFSTQGKGQEAKQTGIALHQWKRDPHYRALIVPPPGYDLLEFDFSGQEFRWMACNANDPVMLSLCEPGQDAHTYMGAKIGQQDYQDLESLIAQKNADALKLRQFGKLANLSCSYRISATAMRQRAITDYDLLMSDAQAVAIHAAYRSTYKQVPEYWHRAIYTAKKHGFAETLAGRRVQLLSGELWTVQNRWNLESTAINFPIQGAGADQKYLALAVLKDYLPKVQGRFYYELHDGLFVVTPHAHTDRAVVGIKHLLSNLPYERAWGVKLPILFPVEAKRGTSWGNLEISHS